MLRSTNTSSLVGAIRSPLPSKTFRHACASTARPRAVGVEPKGAAVVERILHVAGCDDRRQQTSNHTLHTVLPTPLLRRVDPPTCRVLCDRRWHFGERANIGERPTERVQLAVGVSEFQHWIPREDDLQQRHRLALARQMSQMGGSWKRRNERSGNRSAHR
jgi:hypothetical protein